MLTLLGMLFWLALAAAFVVVMFNFFAPLGILIAINFAWLMTRPAAWGVGIEFPAAEPMIANPCVVCGRALPCVHCP